MSFTAEPANGPSGVQQASLIRELMRNRGFIACVVLLSVFAAAFKLMARNLQFVRLPVPLKRTFDQIDRSALLPYKLEHPYPPIKGEMLDALGTDQYLQWLMRDTSGKTEGSENLISLFITYYTGKPDQVPHVPEICYQAQGNKVVADEFDEVSVSLQGKEIVVPVKVLEFEGSRLLGRRNSIVMYTFHANGQFCRDRRDVQSVVGRPGEKYAYFSKLELSFGTPESAPDKAKAVQAGRRFLQVVVPVLLRDHWPDWPPSDVSSGKKEASSGRAP